jgi:tetratricopeptide (TPR) repeat protein
VARYRGAQVDIPKVAAELGVGAVLEGSVRRAGGRVRISAQLINAADGFHLWADRYDRTLDDVFAVQEEIASSIAEALRVALTPAESKSLVKDRPNDVRAYDLYLKGRAEYGRYTAESLRRALDLFQQAAAIDPGYALAYAGIADCYGQMNQWGGADPGWDVNALGLAAAERAIELNPRLPEAYKAKGLVLRFLDDPVGSRAALTKAVEVDPRFTPALVNLAVDEFRNAHLAGCERLLRRVLEVDPQETFSTGWLSFLLCLTSREDEALALTRRLRTLTDAALYVYWSHTTYAWLAMRQDDVAGVQKAVHDALADGVAANLMAPQEAWILARSGRREVAFRRLAPAEHEQGLGAGGLLAAAMAAIAAGDFERAIGFLTRPIIEDFTMVLTRLEPGTRALLDKPPFAPRRLDRALVWPLEAPMIDAGRHALFREVRVESGLPVGSDVTSRR